MRTIRLTNSQKPLLVDNEDYHRCWDFTWSLGTKGTVVWRNNLPHIQIANFIMQDYENTYDHKNHDPCDNQKENLRKCTRSQNNANGPKRDYFRGATSQYKGVCWSKKSKKWHAQLRMNKKSYHLGYFDDEVKAAEAWNRAAIKYQGEFAYLNVIVDTNKQLNNKKD